MKSFIIAFSLFLGSGFWAQAHAQVLISEVHPNPTAGPEWVELYNLGTEPLQLSGWLLEDQLSSPTVAATLSQTLPAASYLVIELPSAKLNNTIDGVTLKNQSGVIVDVMSYSSTTAGKSWHRSKLELSAPFTSADPTPAQPYSSPPPQPSPSPSPVTSPFPSPSPSVDLPTLDQLTPFQLMACPTSGQSEWLELEYTGPVPLDLTEWQVIDQSGNMRRLNGSFTQPGRQRLTWSGSLLNNSGDYLELQAPNEIIYLAGDFTSCKSGQPLSWVNGEWTYTSPSPTPVSLSLTAPLSSSAASLPVQLPASASSSHYTPFNPAELFIGDNPHRPHASPSAILAIEPWQPPLQPFISAILSAGLLTSLSGYLAYDRLQTHHQAVADRLWTSLGLG